MNKKLVVFVLLLLGVVTEVLSQNNCEIKAFSISMKVLSSRPLPNNEGCEVTADVVFNAAFNGGAKNLYIHLWEAAPVNKYSNINYVTPGNPPTAAQLSNTLGTVIIESPGGNDNQVKLGQQYLVSGVKVLYEGITFSRTSTSSGYTYTLNNVKFIVSSCSQDFALKGDVWGSNNNNNVQCVLKDAINLSFRPTISGQVACTNPRTFTVTVNNQKSNVNATANYKVYWDDGDGIFEPTTVRSGTTKDVEVYTSPTIQLGNGSASNAINITPPIHYLPYSNQNPDGIHDLFIEGTVVSELGTKQFSGVLIDNGCALFPVKFSAMSATRSRQNKQLVELVWVTAQEQNNMGFYVQRKTDANWQNIFFVASAAAFGNSTNALTYQFKDQNTYRGLSYYRLLQVDLDGKSSFSPVKAVMGEPQKEDVVMLPNPARGGTVSLVFADEAARNISLSDANGRILIQYRNYTSGSLIIDNLKPGFYMMQAINSVTGAAGIKKLIVQ